MDQPRFLQYHQSVEQLRYKDTHKARTESAERVLLDQLVQIGRQQLKYQA